MTTYWKVKSLPDPFVDGALASLEAEQLLLAGWEPFAADGGTMYFRKLGDKSTQFTPDYED